MSAADTEFHKIFHTLLKLYETRSLKFWWISPWNKKKFIYYSESTWSSRERWSNLLGRGSSRSAGTPASCVCRRSASTRSADSGSSAISLDLRPGRRCSCFPRENCFDLRTILLSSSTKAIVRSRGREEEWLLASSTERQLKGAYILFWSKIV